MWINKYSDLLKPFGLCGIVGLSIFLPVKAQPPLANEHLDNPLLLRPSSNQFSHARQGDRHDRWRNQDAYFNHSRHINHRRFRDPWRWGLGWNNRWGPSIGIGWHNSSYWDNDYYNGYNNWTYPYRRQRYEVVKPVVTVSPPQRVTTSIQYASGLRSLPENAKVIQRDGSTFYQWQGVEYYFDWNTQTYEVVKTEQP